MKGSDIYTIYKDEMRNHYSSMISLSLKDLTKLNNLFCKKGLDLTIMESKDRVKFKIILSDLLKKISLIDKS